MQVIGAIVMTCSSVIALLSVGLEDLSVNGVILTTILIIKMVVESQDALDVWQTEIRPRRAAVYNVATSPTIIDPAALIKKCPICLDDDRDVEEFRVTSCNHMFHTRCLTRWLTERQTCPVCHRVLF